MNKDTKITGIDEIDHITNGSIDQLRNLKNPNQVGQVINKETNEVLSNITPLIMIINQNASDYRERVAALQAAGADTDMRVSYYGRDTTALEIATKYRNF